MKRNLQESLTNQTGAKKQKNKKNVTDDMTPLTKLFKINDLTVEMFEQLNEVTNNNAILTAKCIEHITKTSNTLLKELNNPANVINKFIDNINKMNNNGTTNKTLDETTNKTLDETTLNGTTLPKISAYDLAVIQIKNNEIKLAKIYLLISIEEDNENDKMNAYFELGNYYIKHEQDIKNAIKHYEISLNLGHKNAGIQLGVLYCENTHYKKEQMIIENYELSKNYFLCEIEKNNFYGMFNLAVLYYNIIRANLKDIYNENIQIKNDIINMDLVIKYLKMSIEHNFLKAILMLANIYDEKINGCMEGFKYYEMAAKLNHFESLLKVGNYYFKKNEHKLAEEYFLKIINNIYSHIKINGMMDKDCNIKMQLVKKYNVFCYLAIIYQRRGDHGNMLNYALKGKNCNCSNCALILGKFYEKMKNRKLAFENYSFSSLLKNVTALYIILMRFNDMIMEEEYITLCKELLASKTMCLILSNEQIITFCKMVINNIIVGKKDNENSEEDDSDKFDNENNIINALVILKGRIAKRELYYFISKIENKTKRIENEFNLLKMDAELI